MREDELLSGTDDDRRRIASRLKEFVYAAGGPTKVALDAQIPLRSLGNYLSADAEPKSTVLLRLAEVLGVSVDELLGREAADQNATSGASPPDLVLIPRLDVRASAGSGALIPDGVEHTPDRLGFSEAWLRRLGVSSPRNVEFITAIGDSMEETIRDGDTLLVDRGIHRVVDNGIYIVVIGGLVVVKRLQVGVDGSVALLSDNGRYPPQHVPAEQTVDLQVVGRVRWFGRSI